MGEIAARTRLAQSLVSRTVAKLHDAGVVVTERDPDDGRRVLISIAPDVRTGLFRSRARRPVEPALRSRYPDSSRRRRAGRRAVAGSGGISTSGDRPATVSPGGEAPSASRPGSETCPRGRLTSFRAGCRRRQLWPRSHLLAPGPAARLPGPVTPPATRPYKASAASYWASTCRAGSPGVGTALLAIFAILTTIYAVRAFRKQSRCRSATAVS